MFLYNCFHQLYFLQYKFSIRRTLEPKKKWNSTWFAKHLNSNTFLCRQKSISIEIYMLLTKAMRWEFLVLFWYPPHARNVQMFFPSWKLYNNCVWRCGTRNKSLKINIRFRNISDHFQFFFFLILFLNLFMFCIRLSNASIYHHYSVPLFIYSFQIILCIVIY